MWFLLFQLLIMAVYNHIHNNFAKAQLTASALGQFPPGTIPYQPPVNPAAAPNLQAYQGLQGLQAGIPGLQGLQSQLSQLQQLQALQGLTAGLGGAAGAVPGLSGLSPPPPLNAGLQQGLGPSPLGAGAYTGAPGANATFIPLGQVLIPTGKEVVRNPQSGGYGSGNFDCNNGNCGGGIDCGNCGGNCGGCCGPDGCGGGMDCGPPCCGGGNCGGGNCGGGGGNCGNYGRRRRKRNIDLLGLIRKRLLKSKRRQKSTKDGFN